MLIISCSFEHYKVSNYFITIQIFRHFFFQKKSLFLRNKFHTLAPSAGSGNPGDCMSYFNFLFFLLFVRVTSSPPRFRDHPQHVCKFVTGDVKDVECVLKKIFNDCHHKAVLGCFRLFWF